MPMCSPILMIDPLPNCFSIWPSAVSSALSRSIAVRSPLSLFVLLPVVLIGPGSPGDPDGETIRKGCVITRLVPLLFILTSL